MSTTPIKPPAQPKKEQAIDPAVEEEIKRSKKEEKSNYINYSGVNNTKQFEIKTNLEQTTNEIVYSGKTNCFITLGSDRPSGVGSGYGGKGFTGCSAIDIVAGHLATRPISSINGNKVYSSKNFELDAARVYISQMSNIDEYFNIPQYEAVVGSSKIRLDHSEAKSAVAAKADHVRLIGRESVKIVTHHLGFNALSDDIQIGGVDIIAGCDVPDNAHSPQPMVKGDNLIEFLRTLVGVVQDVQATVTTFLETQIRINNSLLKHKHQLSPDEGISSGMIDTSVISNNKKILTSTLNEIILNNVKFGSMTNKYFSVSSEKYINSKFNRVN